MTHLDPMIALSGSRRAALFAADVRDPQGVLRVSEGLTLEQLSGADFLVNARTLLSALGEALVRATKELGNLELRFVARMLDELRFDAEKLRMMRYMSKRPTEDDVPDLNTLRVVLGLAGLLKKRSGRFSLTQRGHRLLQPGRAAELYELLLRTYFGKFNMFYVYGVREDPVVQRYVVAALWIVRRLAEQPVSSSRIAEFVPRSDVIVSPRDELYERYAPDPGEVLSHVLLAPLRGFGLLSGGERVELFVSRERHPWQVTPLFDEAISFEFGAGADVADADAGAPAPAAGAGAAPGRRHLRLVPDPPEGEPASAPVVEAVPAAPSVARLRVTLRHVQPAVWRRLEVPAGSTFEQLHRYLIAAMGWLDYHLHDFHIGERRIAAYDEEWQSDWPCEDEEGVALGDVLAGGVRTFIYRYDFGDDWEHVVEVEHVGPAEPDVFTPRCLEAAGACPPEDCGGAPGYLRLLDAIADPEDPERAELLEWLGGPFDPTHVDVEGINRLLHLAATGEFRPDDLEYFSRE
jgi:hypothetical protein